MTFDFIKQLSESALVRNEKALKNFNARDAADLIFLYFLGLQILRNDFKGNVNSSEYATKTLQWGDINHFRSSATDLYILMHTLFGSNNESALNSLKDQDANKLLLQNTQFEYQQARRWLSNVAKGKEQTNQDKQFLMKLEAMLLIKNGDYRSIRRLAMDWENLDQQAKQLAMTRLLLALRTRAKRSEILPFLEHMAKENKLEIEHVKNPETEKETKKDLSGIGIGAAISGAIIANSIRKFIQDAPKGKSYK